MEHDYENMILAREESKKQMEAKFQDIYRKIQANKDFTNAEMKRVNDTLKAFRSKFDFELRKMREKFESKIKYLKEFDQEKIKETTDRLDKIENMLETEKNDRIKETDDTLNQTRSNLNQI